MVKILVNKADERILEDIAQDLDGYIKVVVDVKRSILAAGGTRHVLSEELLLKDGSRQADLWGAGLDLETGGIDFDSMINIRPDQNNPSREILDKDLRDKVTDVIMRILK